MSLQGIGSKVLLYYFLGVVVVVGGIQKNFDKSQSSRKRILVRHTSEMFYPLLSFPQLANKGNSGQTNL